MVRMHGTKAEGRTRAGGAHKAGVAGRHTFAALARPFEAGVFAGVGPAFFPL